MKRFLFYHIAIALGLLSLLSCEKEKYSYPYEEYEIEYMGIKSGLTSSSSNAAFDAGLHEVMQAYVAKNPSSGGVVFDGFTYEFTNLQEMTGGVPQSIWDNFWDKLEEYGYSVGSCWGFSYVSIPERGETGTVYVLYTIVTNNYDPEVRYIAVRGNISPQGKTRAGIANENLNDIISNSELQVAKRVRPSR